eukprot:Em0419g11a
MWKSPLSSQEEATASGPDAPPDKVSLPPQEPGRSNRSKRRRRYALRKAKAEFFQPLCDLIETKLFVETGPPDVKSSTKCLLGRAVSTYCRARTKSLLSHDRQLQSTVSCHVRWLEKLLGAYELPTSDGRTIGVHETVAWLCLLARGNSRLAATVFTSAVQLLTEDEDRSVALNELARMCVMFGDRASAWRHFRRSAELTEGVFKKCFGTNPLYVDSCAWALQCATMDIGVAGSGAAREAARSWAQLLKQLPDKLRVLHMAACESRLLFTLWLLHCCC